MSTNITQSHILEKSIDWCGAKLTLQSGKIAKQADSAIFTVMGDTRILTTLVVNKTVSSSATFLPLTVHYQEMMSATGRIPGGFIKREGKPSEQEILVSRLIDRSIRPLFHSDFFHEVQITSTLWSYDPNTDPSILSIIGASAALALSGIPLKSIIGAIRVGLVNDEVVINPQLTQLKKSKLDLVISGDQDNITMIESSANEISEESIASCIKQGVEHMSPVVDFIKDIKATAGKEFSYSGVSQEQSMRDNIASKYSSEIYQGLKITTKYNRDQYFYNLQAEVSAELSAGQDDQVSGINDAFEAAKDTLIRKNILEDGLRINGRTAIEIRDISCETGILPRTHGSSLFTRGETQAMASITLGTTEDEQVVSNIFGEYRESFFLHYAFPPYSVGQCSNPRAPTRREIGHGRLAFKAIERMIPHNKDFPYTIRALCEITESNGSSSQATVCATTLALMDAGIPIKSMVAGIAMGLIKSGNKEIILSDISGEEDHIGDMDFKVAGTQKGITALQMDSKITDISIGTLVDTMQQAKDGRLYILSEMQKVINEPRKTLNSHAPVLRLLIYKRRTLKSLLVLAEKI
jgi:polyribonucleotide nucleotidyltransferase